MATEAEAEQDSPDVRDDEAEIPVNEDLVTLAAFESVSKYQYEVAQDDIKRLIRLKEEALQRPEAYIDSLVKGEKGSDGETEKIRPQPLVPWPNIAWTKYPSIDQSLIPHPFDLMPTPTLGRDVARLQTDFDHLTEGRRKRAKEADASEAEGALAEAQEMRQVVKDAVEHTRERMPPDLGQSADDEEDSSDEEQRAKTREATPSQHQSRVLPRLTNSPGKDALGRFKALATSTRVPSGTTSGRRSLRGDSAAEEHDIIRVDPSSDEDRPRDSIDAQKEGGDEDDDDVDDIAIEPAKAANRSHHRAEASRTKQHAKETPPPVNTAGTVWTPDESRLLEKLLRKYPEGSEPFQSHRYAKISQEMGGTRTPKQVASRCQKLREKEARRQSMELL